MRVAVYARVSTTRQAQAQGIEQQLDRLRAAAAERGWEPEDQHVYRDDGYSGARIGRPGLDRLRDHAALAELDVVLVTAPDRLARNYVHQVLLIDELAGRGCQVEFLDRPMSADPHDQLLLQIRGAVAEYERTLIAERMRRGRQAKLRAGTLLPWTTAPFGYRLDPERPRRADAVRTEPGEAALVAQLFDWYLEPQVTIYRLARRLTDLGVPAPRGGPRWNTASVRGILRNPSYAGRALSNRTQVAPARGRKSAMLPAGPGVSHAPRPKEDWIAVPVPPVVSELTFAQVQAKLDANQQGAARNTRHEYLLRALISCGACRLSCTGRQTAAGYRYYLCRGRTDPLRVAQGERCTARYIPAGQLDELVWADLCALLTDPAQVTRALARAQDGAWLPQELQARQATIGQALGQLERQQQRLLDAYLAEAVTLPELDRKRQDLDRRRDTLLAQQRQLDAAARQKLELGAVADGIEAFCQAVRADLATATFAQRRQLAELLIDRVIVTDGQVEIRYVLPTSPDGPHRPFCQLRKDHLNSPPAARDPGQVSGAGAAGPVAGVIGDLSRVAQRAAGQQPVPAATLPAGPDRDPRPVVFARAVRPGPGRDPLPGPGREGRDQIVGPPLAGGHGQRVAAPDGHHVGHVLAFQPGLQELGLPVGLIGGDPRKRHPGRDRPGDHLLGLPRLGGEFGLPRDARRPAPLPVIGPGPGQVQLPVDQRVPVRRGIRQEHPDLAVLRPPGGPGVLPLHAGRPGALLQEPGVIGDQHPIRLAQLLHHVSPDVIADPVHVPVRPAQQPLHPIRADLAGPFRQRPPVLPLQARDQPGHILPHPGPRLRTGEPAPDPLVQLVQPGRDNIHHHALNDALPAHLSAVAVLTVKTILSPGTCSEDGDDDRRAGREELTVARGP
jgi:site-specific DNA recombinase